MYDTLAEATVGETLAFGSYVVDADEIVDFAEQYDPQPFHLDPAAAAESQFGGLVASGWHTAAMTQRLLVDHVLDGSGVMGSPGVSDLRWLRPVRPGDSLSVQLTVADTEIWDDDRGAVHFELETRRADETPVMEMTVEVLFPTGE